MSDGMANPKSPVRLSIISAVLNPGHKIEALTDSLRTQTTNFHSWVIADGGSTDGTIEFLRGVQEEMGNVIVDSQPDSGIYSALNRAHSIADCDYYIVLGADDSLERNAIQNYLELIMSSNSDLISARVKVAGKLMKRAFPPWLWLFGPSARISSHSVGTAIRSSLHTSLGPYDESYRLYGDGHFLLKAIRSGATVESGVFTAGTFSAEGRSNRNQLQSFCEQLRAQVELGGDVRVQLALFVFRVWKWRRAIVERGRGIT